MGWSGDLTLAVDDYTLAIMVDPTSLNAYLNQGSAYGRLGRYAEAVIDYGNALHLALDSPTLYTNRWASFHAQDDLQRALAAFKKAVSPDPTSTSVWYDLGVVHDDLGDLGKAVGNYGQAIILQTDNIDALINRALVYSKPGEHASAIEDMNCVVEIAPTYAKASLVRASAHAKLGLPPVPGRP